jgi:glycosyltransferase involved in cell wall biosynthesis
MSSIPLRRLQVLGIRGVPAAHGGFETFAEYLVLWLVERGWDVTVYCQNDNGDAQHEDYWCGVRRVHIPVRLTGAVGTIEFDAKATAEALRRPGVLLTLGYNTGFLSAWVAMKRRTNAINMDGLEWKRSKYGVGARAYLYFNERIAALVGTRLVADHPSIADHLATRVARDRITMIAYGAAPVVSAESEALDELGLSGQKFMTIIARPEPENSILEIVEAFSRRRRGATLLVLGKYSQDQSYQARVMAAASPEVRFVGAIYDKRLLAAIRLHCTAYLHGHQVGGTNPSLVEALGAGNAVIAHDNRFNRWVAGDAGRYFDGIDGCDAAIQGVLDDPTTTAAMQAAARVRFDACFTWPAILQQYEAMLADLVSLDRG